MQLFLVSLQTFNLNLSIALSEAVSGMILISAFLPLDSFAFRFPVSFSCSSNLVLTISPFSPFNSRISALIFLSLNLLLVRVISSFAPSLSLIALVFILILFERALPLFTSIAPSPSLASVSVLFLYSESSDCAATIARLITNIPNNVIAITFFIRLISFDTIKG